MNLIKKICFKKTGLFLAALLCVSSVSAKKPNLKFKDEAADFEFSLKGKLFGSTDGSVGGTLLNTEVKNVFGDRIDAAIAPKFKMDLTGHIDHSMIEAQCTVRTRFPYGSSNTNYTTTVPVKLDKTLFGDHNHSIQLKIIYLQEAWVELDLAQMLGYDSGNQTFTVGVFPFYVGRG